MEPSTTITLGFCSIIATVIGACWLVFRYIGKIENNITQNKNDLDHLFEKLRETKQNTAKYINLNTNNITDVEEFLNSKFSYQIRIKCPISEKDL